MNMNNMGVVIDVTFPVTGKVRRFKSIRRVAMMLSGNGTASGGLRKVINTKAFNALCGRDGIFVRRHQVYG